MSNQKNATYELWGINPFLELNQSFEKIQKF